MKFFRINSRLPLIFVLPFSVLVTGEGFAQEAEQGALLVQGYRCYACHDQTETLIGPPYQAIAARHAGNKDVMVDILAKKIILGGGGNWGVVPMVPNEQVSEEHARDIASWILDQAP